MPRLSTVPRAWPSPAEEETGDLLSFDEWLLPRKEASFLLRVENETLAGEGILPGDAVIVERGRQAKSGDIVLAEIDGDWTLLLSSAVGKSPTSEVRTGRAVGVVTAVIRKYH